MPPADTARSHAQPCWLGIQLRCCAARGARCWSEIRLRRVEHSAPGTDSAQFTTISPLSILPLYMYRYICTYINIYIYIYMYICIYICIYIYTCIRICISLRVYICTHTHTHKNMRILPHNCWNTLHMYSKKLKYVCYFWLQKISLQGACPSKHGSLPRAAVLVGNPTALLCSTWGALLVGNPTAARGAHGAGHGLSTVYDHLTFVHFTFVYI